MRIVCKKKLDGDKVYDHKTIFILSIAFVILAFGMMAIYDYPVIRYAIICIMLIVCWCKRDKLMGYFKMIKEK